MNKQYFILFSNCIIVKGISRSIICDIQNTQYELVPNELYYLFKDKSTGLDLHDLYSKITKEDKIIVMDYLNFLFKKGFGFWSEKENKGLVPLKKEWKSFASISNCIIEYSENNKLPWVGIVNSLNELNCFALEIRFYKPVKLKKITSILQHFKNSKIRSISLLITYNKDLTRENLDLLTKNNVRLSEIFIHTCQDDIQNDISDNLIPINFTATEINSNSFCGLVLPKFFSIGIEHYTEAINHNTCLNRKVSIDINGDIKNCPSMPENYGNISHTTIEEAIEKPKFKKYWKINKDQIIGCKDCEFRYICTDCRAFKEDPKDDYSKPLKCGYSPYTNKWEDWSINSLKRDAIEYYSLKK